VAALAAVPPPFSPTTSSTREPGRGEVTSPSPSGFRCGGAERRVNEAILRLRSDDRGLSRSSSQERQSGAVLMRASQPRGPSS